MVRGRCKDRMRIGQRSIESEGQMQREDEDRGERQTGKRERQTDTREKTEERENLQELCGQRHDGACHVSDRQAEQHYVALQGYAPPVHVDQAFFVSQTAAAASAGWCRCSGAERSM
jgi:hypothetical protein